MKKVNSNSIKKILLASLVIVLSGCGKHTVQSDEVQQGNNHSSTDLFEHKSKVLYAQNFSVSYHGYYKVVKASATLGEWDTPGSETEDVTDVMVLVQQGYEPPPLTGELANAQVIRIPANERIATNASNLEIWLDMLGLTNRLVAIGGTKTYNDSLRQLISRGTIGQVGYSWAAPPDMEVLLHQQPDIFLMVISRVGFNQSLSKIRALGIQAIPVFDWAERDYMATAEWIKHCALFFNKEKEANQWFDKIIVNVNALKGKVSGKERPTVLWAHYVDKGFWLAQTNNPEARLLKDAGVRNVTEDFSKPFSPIGEALTNEQLLVVGGQADHWIIGNGVRALLPDKNYLDGFKAWRNGNLYHHYKRSKPAFDAYDWFNLWPVRPDIALADLIRTFHPEVLPEHERVFVGNLKKE